MYTKCKFIWPLILALTLSGTAFAHDPGHRGGYSGGYNDGWGGSATVWGDSTGYTAWSGTMSYGAGYGYAPGRIPWAAGHRHQASCHHGPGRGYARGYTHGYKHGNAHGHRKGWGRH